MTIPIGKKTFDVEVNDEVLNAQDLNMPDIEGLQLLNANVVNQDASGSGNDLAANASQINNLVDNDQLNDPSVKFDGANGGGYNSTGADFNVTGTAIAGSTTATNNLASVGHDGTISDAANASTVASGGAAAFSQSINTGGNTQVNSSTIDFEGGTSQDGGYPNGGWVFPEHKDGKDGGPADIYDKKGEVDPSKLADVLEHQPLHNGIELHDDLINARYLSTSDLDGLQVLTANVVNQDVSGPGNDAAANVNQMNNGVDNNKVYDPSVKYDGGNGGTQGDPDNARGGDVIVSANGYAAGASSTVNNAQVHDDGSISNAGNASSSGSALGQAFTQAINTNGDTQANTSTMFLEGGSSVGSQNNPATYGHAIDVDSNLIDAQYLQVCNLDGIQLLDGTLVNQRVSGSGNDYAINVHQTNNLVGNDHVTDPSVSYGKFCDPAGQGGTDESARGGNFSVTADSTGGFAESGSNTAHIQGSGTISGAANALSSADSSAQAFTQTITTGGNLQVNQSRIVTDGGTSVGNGGPAGHQRDQVTLDSENVNARDLRVDNLNGIQMLKGDVVNQNGTGGGNDTVANIGQMNNLVDNDSISHPSIRYNGGNGGTDWATSGGSFTLTATATAAAAFSHNNNAFVDESGSISSAGNATSSATANADAFVQTLTTGGNTQDNASTAVIDGGISNPGPNGTVPGGDDGHHDGPYTTASFDHPQPGPDPEPVSHDCNGPSVCDDQQVPYHDPAITINSDVVDAQCMSVCDLQGIQFLDGHVTNQDVSGAGNDAAFNIDQINNLVDNDCISCPTVSYSGGDGGIPSDFSDAAVNGFAGANGGDFSLSASAHSGTATTNGNTASIHDDGSISGAGSASSSAIAHADAFSQHISMGANLQVNTSTLDVLGGLDHHA